MQDELHEWYVQDLMHRAMHSNDPDLRAALVSEVSFLLLNGYRIAGPVRRWLAWTIQIVHQKGNLPHLSRGPIVDQRRYVAFIKRLHSIMTRTSAEKRITKRLEAAAEELHVSFETVREAFYGDVYKHWSLFLANSPQQ